MTTNDVTWISACLAVFFACYAVTGALRARHYRKVAERALEEAERFRRKGP